MGFLKPGRRLVVMWKLTLPAVVAMSLIGLSASSIAYADEDEKQDLKAVATHLAMAKVTLQQGLTAAEQKGQPISGKFEIDEGHFQLSVYTLQGGKYSENLVDYHTGTVIKAEAITGGDDLKEAKEQSQAMGKAKKSLKAAVDEAEHKFAGYRAVSVEAEVKNGHTVAVVTLLKGAQSKTTSEPLE
jgi:hypothetical protein